ncbi:MAG: HNH endonuclease [Moraxellaceae bacterium]|nr:HNH endonuclease [Moraxellaceae bacterium]MDZ4387348.1 HNH endonuclease [Moraxellaceae bacterium]
MIYCPYTNSEIEESEVNREHIIPLSLGGINGFEIPVCKTFNSVAGSKIDGKLANDFLVLMKRNEHDIRGHSGKKPAFVGKNSVNSDTGTPIQVTFDKKTGLKLYCPITKRELSRGESRSFSTKIEMSIDIDTQFVAKTALSAGYFAYGELFRRSVKHEELRIIMNNSPNDMGDEIYNIETRVDWRFSDDQSENLQIFRLLCNRLNGCSVVGLVQGPKSLSIFVGILGYYIGMVNVPAETKGFPNEGAYHWGHVICPQKGDLKRVSFKRALEKLAGLA